jgi:hypothetical protein
MPDEGSVTRWIDRLKAGEAARAAEVTVGKGVPVATIFRAGRRNKGGVVNPTSAARDKRQHPLT